MLDTVMRNRQIRNSMQLQLIVAVTRGINMRLWELFWLLVVLVPTWTPQADAADLVEAVKELQQWESRFVTIRVQSRRELNSATNSLLRQYGIDDSVSDLDWIWEDSGRFLHASVDRNDGKISRSVQMANQKRYYQVKFAVEDPVKDIPAVVMSGENTLANTGAKLLYPPFHFLWDEGSRTWLGSRLVHVTSSRSTDDGMLEIEGGDVGFDAYRIQLDPQHGYLPRQGVIPNAVKETRFFVEEFQEVQPGFWFPKRGTLVLNGDMHEKWSVSQVELNAEYPDNMFQPRMGDGTYVMDSISGKNYWHGGKPPETALTKAKSTADSASAPIPVSIPDNVINARRDHPVRWAFWLGLFGILAIAVGLLMRRAA